MRFLLLTFLSCAFAQDAKLTLREAVQRAAERYPAVRVSAQQVTEAAAGIALARTALLPKADFIAQVNRSTVNNVFGLTFPNSVIPPISGPQLTNGSEGRNVWGTATGVLFTWEPFDFGRRQGEIDAAGAQRARAEAGVARTKLDVSAATADAYLTVLAARQTVLAAQAAVGRNQEFEKILSALTRAELRPGSDLSRLQAEGVVAQTQVVRAEQAVAMGGALLEQYVGGPADAADVPLMTAAAEQPAAIGFNAGHPYLREQQAGIEEVIARMKALDKSWYPRFAVQGSAFGRGTGARVNGAFAGGGYGLYPDHGNWAAGLTVTFPILEYKTLRARKEIEVTRQGKEVARRELVQRELDGRLAQARAQLDGARKIAELAPKQTAALRTALDQTQARYRAGLGNILDVADAQRQLTQAEIDTALARLGVWRAELAVAHAQGDLEPFLARLP